MQAAAQVGVTRYVLWRSDGLQHRNGMSEEDGWRANIEGACGEMAAAKFLGVYWNGSINTYRKGGDLGANIEVKTRSRHDYDLLVRTYDVAKPKVYVLVTGNAPDFRVRGWIVLDGPQDCKDEWLKTYANRPEAWFIPVSALSQDWDLFREAIR